MLEQIWNGFLDLTSQLVIPDWGKLIVLALPVGTTVLVVLLMGRTVLQVATVPAARRGKQRIIPATPAGIHMPGPSFAPIFAAIGAFLLFLGLVFGGIALILGAIALVLTLLYWLAEGLRIYDHDIAPTATVLPAVPARRTAARRARARPVVAPDRRGARDGAAVPRAGVRRVAAGRRA